MGGTNGRGARVRANAADYALGTIVPGRSRLPSDRAPYPKPQSARSYPPRTRARATPATVVWYDHLREIDS